MTDVNFSGTKSIGTRPYCFKWMNKLDRALRTERNATCASRKYLLFLSKLSSAATFVRRNGPRRKYLNSQPRTLFRLPLFIIKIEVVQLIFTFFNGAKYTPCFCVFFLSSLVRIYDYYYYSLRSLVIPFRSHTTQ